MSAERSQRAFCAPLSNALLSNRARGQGGTAEAHKLVHRVQDVIGSGNAGRVASAPCVLRGRVMMKRSY